MRSLSFEVNSRAAESDHVLQRRTSLNSLYSSSGMIFSMEYRARTRREPGSMPFRGTWELSGNHSSIIWPFCRRFNWQRMNTDGEQLKREVRGKRWKSLRETVSQTADCLENPQMYLQMSLSLLFFVLLLRLISNLLISLDRSLKQQIKAFCTPDAKQTQVCEKG